MRTVSRREFVSVVAATAGGVLGCGPSPGAPDYGSSRLTARPLPPTGTVSPGVSALGLGTPDGFLHTPAGYDPARAWPLVVAFHGAGARHTELLDALGPFADARGFFILATDSSAFTWDVIRGRYGPDVELLDRALSATFARAAVDPERIIVNGFSDGASYALGLGLSNGDLFTRIVAFSPGFVPASETPDRGEPRIFVSHGRDDPVLPIDLTSRSIVAALRGDGYDVTFVEFDGGHVVPIAVGETAIDWMLAEVAQGFGAPRRAAGSLPPA